MKSKILITDERPDVSVVDEFHDADIKKVAREQTVTKWLLGHACDVLQDNNPNIVTMLVGEQRFLDRRSEYPSEKLVANMSLAIYAGEGLAPSNFDIQDLNDATVAKVLASGVIQLYGTGLRSDMSGYALPSAYRGGKP